MKQKGKPKRKHQKPAKVQRPWKYLIALGLIAFLLYSPSIQYEWALDDASAISENFVTKKGFAGIKTHLSESYRFGYWTSEATLYRPISLIMFAIEWQLSPDNPTIHHFVNVLMYALLAMFAFLLLARITKSKFWAFLITILFVVHPVHVEAVANIKSRDEIMALLFGVIALNQWMKYLDKKHLNTLLLGIGAYLLAMFSKESSITLLAIFPAISFLFYREKFQSHLMPLLSFLAPVGFYLLVRMQVLESLGAGGLESSPLDNLLFAAKNAGDGVGALATAILILGKYLLALIFPINLGSDFGFNQIPIVGFSDWRVLLSIIIHGGLIYIIFKYWKKYPLLVFGAFFYIATMSIFSNVIIAIGSSYGERFLFGPSLGFILMAVAALRIWVEKKQGSLTSLEWSSKTQLPILACGIFGLFFIGKTIQRMPAWMNSMTLYEADIKTAPNSAKLNYHYGLENAKAGRDAKNPQQKQSFNGLAKKHFDKAISVYPNYADAYAQLGLLSFRSGDSNKAMQHYQKSLSISPTKSLVYSNMGIIYFNAGKLKEAEEVYLKALQLNPKFADGYQNLGAVYARQKRFDLAIQNFRKGLTYDPDNKTLNFYLGSALRDSGKASEGAQYLEKAKRLGQ